MARRNHIDEFELDELSENELSDLEQRISDVRKLRKPDIQDILQSKCSKSLLTKTTKKLLDLEKGFSGEVCINIPIDVYFSVIGNDEGTIIEIDNTSLDCVDLEEIPEFKDNNKVCEVVTKLQNLLKEVNKSIELCAKKSGVSSEDIWDTWYNQGELTKTGK
jgi:hypothetical protein